jgi:hypothetical protein
MINIAGSIQILLDRLDKAKQDGNQNEILYYAILAEAKHNNDLAKIIHNYGANEAVNVYPHLFSQFYTTTSEILLTLGIPAYKVFKESNIPKEKDIKELENTKATKKLFKSKNTSELYEFYIRKCNLIKALYNASSLEISSIKLHLRCQNIENATRELIIKLEQNNKNK